MLSENVQLSQSTGYPHIDELLRGIIGVYEVAFPGRILGYYLLGSHADKTAIPGSDVDLVVIFKDTCQEDELDNFHSLTAHLTQVSPVVLDSSFRNEASLLAAAPANIKAGIVVYGSDRREDFTLESLDLHIARAIYLALRSAWVLRGMPDTLSAPLNYPEDGTTFYGYTRYGRYLGEWQFSIGLQMIVAVTSMMATTLLALKTGKQAGTRQAGVRKYEQHVGDEWTDFITEVYRVMRLRWQGQIPEDRRDQEHLHNLCQWLLGFENYFLKVCKSVLLLNLNSSSELVRYYTLEALQCVSYDDQEFIDALQDLSALYGQTQAARAVLARIRR